MTFLTTILYVVGALVGFSIVGYIITWFIMNTRKAKEKQLAEIEFNRLKGLPVTIEKKSLLRRIFSKLPKIKKPKTIKEVPDTFNEAQYNRLNNIQNPQIPQLSKEQTEEELVSKLKELQDKKDLKLFNEANKELEKFTKEYNEGKITYEALKGIFNDYQSQDYYKKIAEDYK